MSGGMRDLLVYPFRDCQKETVSDEGGTVCLSFTYVNSDEWLYFGRVV